MRRDSYTCNPNIKIAASPSVGVCSKYSIVEHIHVRTYRRTHVRAYVHYLGELSTLLNTTMRLVTVGTYMYVYKYGGELVFNMYESVVLYILNNTDNVL